MFPCRDIDVFDHGVLPQTSLGMLHNIRCMHGSTSKMRKTLSSENHLVPRVLDKKLSTCTTYSNML